VGTAHIEAESYSDNAVPNKHCCDNSKYVSMEIPVLVKYSVAWSNPQPRSYHCYATNENPVSRVVRENRVTRPRDKCSLPGQNAAT
jgi:hypothetical protein